MSTTTRTPPSTSGWRTVDILVAAVLAVATGVVFFAWNQLYAAVEPLFTAFPPASAVMYPVWLVPGVIGGLVVRKPGAAVFTSVVAALVSALLGNQWGLITVASGLVQGLLPEVVFALGRYRRWGLATAVLAGAAAGGLGAAPLDLTIYFTDWSGTWMAAYAAIVTVAGAVAGWLAWLFVRALARSGVLSSFASGREQASV